MPIELNPEEARMRDAIQEGLDQMRAGLSESPIVDVDSDKLNNLGKLGHKIHMSLAGRNNEPKHHWYMIENRELQPDHPKFYMHIHPLEDLLKFIEDPSANDDPKDVTLNQEFEFVVYTPRWGHDDTYSLTRTEDGWHFNFGGRKGPCDKRGRPYLYECFQNDSINYPSGFEWRLMWLWDQAKEKGLSREDVQARLEELSQWLRDVEESRPKDDFWWGA